MALREVHGQNEVKTLLMGKSRDHGPLGGYSASSGRVFSPVAVAPEPWPSYFACL